MEPIVKLNHIEQNLTKHIYIFSGAHQVTPPEYIGPEGTSIFSANELTNIRQKGITVTIVNAYLHSDDTIDTVKKKISKYIGAEVATQELYLFGLQEKILNPAVVYNQLTQIDTLDLTRNRLCQYLLNIISSNCTTLKTGTTCTTFLPTEKEIYDFDDFLSLPAIDWEAPLTSTIPIGQKMMANMGKRYPFTANPYNCTVMDEITRKHASNNITTQNSNLLFEYGAVCGNNLFLCLASEVLTYAKTLPHLSEMNFLSIYFPNLVLKSKIHSLEELSAKHHELYTEEKDKIGKNFNKYNERVDLFYNMYASQQSRLDYINNTPGIVSIEFTIHPRYNITFPLKTLFKLIHSDEHIPMIKYNPGINRENIYRLFTNNITATNGRKIPYLYTSNNNKKGKIIQLSRQIARKKRVAFYIQVQQEHDNHEIYCSFEPNGSITVKFEPKQPMDLADIEQLIKTAINKPILERIKSYLERSGYSYILFHNLTDDNIEIKQIRYVTSLVIKKNIRLTSYIGCLSSIFNVIEGALTAKQDTITMRYKRVSNYHQMDSIESFINDIQRLGRTPAEIIKELKSNFQLSPEDAQARFANWLSLIRTEKDLFENKTFTNRTNTGFPVSIQRNPNNLQAIISVDGINHIQYLKPLHIYLDSMLRIVMDKNSTAVKVSHINDLCKGKKSDNLLIQGDIQAQTEKDFVERRASIAFSPDEKGMADFLDIFAVEEDETPTGEEFDDEDIEFGTIIGQDSPQYIADTEPSQDAVKTPTFSPQTSEISESDSPRSEITSEAEVDLKGMLLKGNNNIFITKKMKLQPKLFLKNQKGRFKAYSKACPSQYAKQPVILTNKEKAYIDEQDQTYGTKSYDESVTYGTGDTKYHYICPRFWCLYDKNGRQRSLSLKEVNEGECGGWDALIPAGAAKVPDGKRIFQFTDKRFHKEGVATNNPLVYKPMWPGFMDPSKHPNDLCIPCCFTRPTQPPPPWKTHPAGRRNTYINEITGQTLDKLPVTKLVNMYKPEGNGGKQEGGPGPTFTRDAEGNIILSSVKGTEQSREAPAKKRIETYNECNQARGTKAIQTRRTQSAKSDAPLLEAWPLKMGQLGYLPVAVQKFLGYNCRLLCQQSATDRHLKKKQPCLLHKGVEKSELQSFIGCIADAYDAITSSNDPMPQKLNKAPLKTIRAMKQIIIAHLTLDNFVAFQNGNLVKLFQSPDASTININPYKQSTLYQTLQENDDKSEKLMRISDRLYRHLSLSPPILKMTALSSTTSTSGT